MKYTEAWASVLSQNINLKIATILLGAMGIVVGLIALRQSFKESIIIERGCFSRGLQAVKDDHSKTEVEAFIKEALAQRFDSEAQPVDGLLSPDELRLRVSEQKEFSSRNMKQRIIVNQVKETADGFIVEADRIISVNDVRSAFRFPLAVKLESKSRSYSDPYGLLLVTTKTIDEKPSESLPSRAQPTKEVK